MLLFQLFWCIFWLLDLFLDCCEGHFSVCLCFMFFIAWTVCMYVCVKQRKNVLNSDLMDEIFLSLVFTPSIWFLLFFDFLSHFCGTLFILLPLLYSLCIAFYCDPFSILTIPCTFSKLRLCLILFMLFNISHLKRPIKKYRTKWSIINNNRISQVNFFLHNYVQ